MTLVRLKFEVMGLPVASLGVETVMMPALRPAPQLEAEALPALDGADGYYFPSAILGPEMADDGADLAALPTAPRGFFWLLRSRFPRYFHDLTQSYEDFLAGKSAKTRSTLRRKLRKFESESDGRIDWRVYRSGVEMREFHRLAVVLARRTYQAKLYDAALPEEPAFVEDMARKAEAGEALGFLLFLRGEVIAYLYTPIADSRVIYGYLGFDSEHRDLSPGTVLQLLVMQWCFENESLTLFDFTEGEGAHKALFSSHKETCADLLLLKRSLRLLSLAMAYRFSIWLSLHSVGLLDRLGLKAPIKAWLRRTRQAEA